jgi:thioredoxin 1
MSENMLEINAETFDSEVLKADKPVLVDFSAVWCGPCKMLDPIVDELAGEWGDSVKVVKLDIDHSPDVAIRYQVLGVPTLMVFKAGQVAERLVGYKPKDKIVEALSPHLQLA